MSSTLLLPSSANVPAKANELVNQVLFPSPDPAQAALGAHGGVLLSCLLWMLVLGCSHITQGQRQGDVAGKVPHVGESMPAGASVAAVEHKGRQLCTHWIRASGVRYNFDVSCGASIVVYAQTDYPHFRTPEGIAVGDLCGKALFINGSMMDVIDGTCGVALPSGWIARLGLATETKSSCKERAGEPSAFLTRALLDSSFLARTRSSSGRNADARGAFGITLASAQSTSPASVSLPSQGGL